MPRVQLRVYTDPGQAEVFINLKRNDNTDFRLVAVVDTGAEVSLLPDYLTGFVEHKVIDQGSITVEQAGIAHQSFSATEAVVRLFLEDETGNRTQEFEAQVWFANTRETLIGFKNILDRAVLYIDSPKKTGWIEMD